jgi:hypothetical protein
LPAARRSVGVPAPGARGLPRTLAAAAVFLLVLLLAPAASPELDPAAAKLLAKLEAKLANKELKLEETQAGLLATQEALLAAQLELLDAQALPEGTPEEAAAKQKAVKQAEKAIKKATAKTAKLGKKLDKVNAKIDDLVAQIEELDPGHFDDTAGGDPGGGDPGGGDPGAGDPGGDPQGGGNLDPAASQAILAVDCGDLNGYAEPEAGWELLSESEAPAGVSLSPAPLDTVHVAQYFPGAGLVAFPSDVATLDPDQVDQRRLFTSLSLAEGSVLTVGGLQPDADLRVLLEVGAISPWTELVGNQWTALPTDAPDVDVDAWLGGAFVGVAHDLRASTPLSGAALDTDLGGIVRAWVPVVTNGAGEFRLRFSSSDGGAIHLASFTVFAREELPIAWRHGAAGPLQSAEPDAQAFVSAFNAGDLDAAEEAAAALEDDWLRGVAQCHLIGWLDGSRDGRVHLLDEAAAALVAARDAGHPGGTWLLSQLQSFERALRHIAAADTEAAKACPGEGGFGYLNPDCAGQVYTQLGQSEGNLNVQIAERELCGLTAPAAGPTALHDVLAFGAGTLAADRWSPSPFLPRALKQRGVNVTLMNPQLSFGGGSPILDGLQELFAAFVDLGLADTDFADELELRLFDAYAQAGSHPKDWDAADWNLFSDAQIAASWWGGEAQVPAENPAAPLWANAQRAFLRLYRNLCEYWLLERLQDGELGGGVGDDVEALLQFFPLQLVLRDEDQRLLASALDDVAAFVLDDHPLVGQGYYSGDVFDVEHTAEFTTNPFLATRGAFGLTARAGRLAFFNAREILDAEDPASAFVGVNSAGRARFRGYWYTAAGPDDDPDHALDVFLNGRALAPALALAGRGAPSSGHAALADLRTLATGWRDDALVSAGKPAGFPAPARWPDGALGAEGLWYTASGVAGDASTWQLGEVSYVLGLLHGAYRGSTSADRWQFLLPTVRMFRAVQEWEDAGEPSGAAGSVNWVAQQFREGARFGHLVATLAADLAGDPTLASAEDPLHPGSTYVDAQLLERLDDWADSNFLDQGGALVYAVGPVNPCAPKSAKSPMLLGAPYDQAVSYFRMAWPLLTARVLHTDRIFLNPGRVLRELEVAFTGEAVVEGLPLRPLVRWAGAGLDLAVSTNLRTLDGQQWSAFVHNFAPAPADVTLVLEEGLAAGEWLLEAGAAVQTCDTLPGAASTSTLVTKRGPCASVALQLPPGLSLVRLQRTGSAPAPAAWDLAVDPPRLAALPDGGYEASVRVINLGSSAAPASALSLHVAAVDEDGLLASPTALPMELLLSSANVALGAVSGWDLPETVKTFSIPAGSPVGDLLQQGYGLQLRAVLQAAAAEGDPLNNAASRCWFLEQVPPAD